MRNLVRKAMSLLGEKQRHSIYRKMASAPPQFFDPDFKVEIARTREDLERAYQLLHDCYVGIKLIDPQPSGLRCNLFSFLPTSTIIVAKYRGKVVGTVSAVKDSGSGLPSDKEFPEENNHFRAQGKVLVEASALAVAPEHRVGHSVSFLLMKFLYIYCRDHFRADYMIGAVHPKSEDFYKALWQFEKNGQPLAYGSLKGAAAIHISLDLSHEHFSKISHAFGPPHPTRNLATMVNSEDSRFHYPSKQRGISINPVITPEKLRYFCLEQKEVWKNIGLEDRKTLMRVYSTYFGRAAMTGFDPKDLPSDNDRAYRTPIRLHSIANVENTDAAFCEIQDLTSRGCFLKWIRDLPMPGSRVTVSFRFQNRNYSIDAKVAWRNAGQSLHHQRGIGLAFQHTFPEIDACLQEALYAARDIAA